MTRRVLRAGTLGAVVLAGALIAMAFAASAQASAEGPALHLSAATAEVGTSEVVTGSGWAPGAQLQIEVCGIGGSSNDCNLQDAVLATANPSGAFTAYLRVSEPPTPCPCTVHAAPFAGTSSSPADVPIAIPKLRYMPEAATPIVGAAKLLDVAVSDDSSPLTQLGAEGAARVTVTFANLSGGPANDPGVTLILTRGAKTVGRYPMRWTGDALAVGQRRALVYDVPLPGGWFRDYSIGVAVGDAAGKSVTVRTVPAAVRPWGELLAPFALVLGVGFILVGRRRKYEVVPALPVREGAPAGRRSGIFEPQPFARIEPATLGILVPEPPAPAQTLEPMPEVPPEATPETQLPESEDPKREESREPLSEISSGVSPVPGIAAPDPEHEIF
jgi:hypothetical protein